MDTIISHLAATRLMSRNKSLIPNGFFANIVPINNNGDCVAISTDGVGTKVLVAQKLKKYDTIGIDCVAMNVNDILCVGALPISMVDYIAMERRNDDLLKELAVGLSAGAREAQIEIVGGETAIVPRNSKWF